MKWTRATREVLEPGVDTPAGAVASVTQAVRRRDDLEALGFLVAFLVVAVTLGAAPLV